VLIVNQPPHPARQATQAGLPRMWCNGIRALIYADVTGLRREKGPDADLPGFDITALLGLEAACCL